MTNIKKADSSTISELSQSLGAPKAILFKCYWLIGCFILTLLMIIVGGLTRLTNSGLSMVDWQPILGIFPPLTQEAWNEAFQAYQQYPEYQLLYPNMSLYQFQFIFAFEYGHRMLGRLIGVATFLPLVLLWIKGFLMKQEKVHLSLLVVLVCIQGLAGWFMVKSGLIENPYISHYRLALHFSLALLFISYILLLLLSYRTHYAFHKLKQKESMFPATQKWLSLSFLNIIICFFIIQILYGTFMAGLDAGRVSSTYPKMFGQWIPTQVLSYAYYQAPLKAFIENTTWIHFIHRHLGIVTSCLFLAFVLRSIINYKKTTSPAPTSQSEHPDKLPYYTLYILGILSILQPLTGILTVIWQIPISFAIIHQLLAVLLFLTLLILYFYRLRIGLLFNKN